MSIGELNGHFYLKKNEKKWEKKKWKKLKKKMGGGCYDPISGMKLFLKVHLGRLRVFGFSDFCNICSEQILLHQIWWDPSHIQKNRKFIFDQTLLGKYKKKQLKILIQNTNTIFWKIWRIWIWRIWNDLIN